MNKIFIMGAMGVALTSIQAKADFMQCIACPAGSKCDGINKSPCEAGTFSTGGASSCSQCSAGTFSTGGAGSCSPCGAGHISSAGASSCSPCGAGTRSNSTSASTSCVTCPADTYSGGGASSCTPCGELEWSNAGASSCSGLQYQIESTIADLGFLRYELFDSTKTYLQSGTLQPGFYLIILGGGDGGDSVLEAHMSGQAHGLGVNIPSLYGKGAQLKYIFKVTSETSYTIASASYGEAMNNEGGYGTFATGGGGGAWAKIGGTNYIAGGGGGAPATNLRRRIGASGGNGGAIGVGGVGGVSLDNDEENPLVGSGSSGGSSGNSGYNGSLNYYGPRTESPGADGHESSNVCYTTSNNNTYGGVGGILSDIQCPGFTQFLAATEEEKAVYWKAPTDGKASHSDNTGGRFADKLCKNCARLYKIK